ncbi:MAG: hypothetical protein MJ016_07605, partial [Victivallaceae bacterium]|nr:hypothetical protein [Victivallaceae bacterium]
MKTGDPQIEKKIGAILSTLSLREKIGQTMQYSLNKIDKSSDASIGDFFEKYPLGSIFAGLDVIAKWSSGENSTEIVERCQKFCKVPLAVAGDLEHGTKNLVLPGPLALAAARDEKLAFEYGKWIGRAGKAAGFSWSYSPECDIALNWMNPINNHRGMGDDPELVAAVGRKMAYRVGVSGKIFAKLGENGVNIRMITQGPEELTIIVGV